MTLKCVVIAIGCLIAQGAVGAQPAVAASPAQPDTIDEVLVQGTRLRELKAAIVQAEDRFYARYNELNKVDDYDVECAMDAHTGTKIPQRRCFTRLQLESKAQQGIETLQMFQDQAADLAGRPPNTNPEGIWLARYDDYRDNMLYLLKTNPDLRRLAQEGEAAQRRYDAELKRRMKGRLILIER